MLKYLQFIFYDELLICEICFETFVQFFRMAYFLLSYKMLLLTKCQSDQKKIRRFTKRHGKFLFHVELLICEICFETFMLFFGMAYLFILQNVTTYLQNTNLIKRKYEDLEISFFLSFFTLCYI